MVQLIRISVQSAEVLRKGLCRCNLSGSVFKGFKVVLWVDLGGDILLANEGATGNSMPLQQVVTHHVTDLDQIFTNFYMANIIRIRPVIGYLGVGNMDFRIFQNFGFEIPIARRSV